MYTQRSFVLKPADKQQKWYLIDAQDQIVGRLATEIASILRGKSNPQFTKHVDSGDFVVVINASKIKFTGNKLKSKIYYKHTNHVGGLKSRTAKEHMQKDPTFVLMHAIQGMLGKNTLGRNHLTKVRIFPFETHDHTAQSPIFYKTKDMS